MAVKFGTIVPQGWRMDLVDIADPVEKYEAMTRVGQEAERLGFDSIWLYDHFHTVPTAELETTFECWTTTAGLARDTKTIRIGQMVTCNSYRNPALLAKIASTVDVMSHGRLDFGIGAGWYEHEYQAYGYALPRRPGAPADAGRGLADHPRHVDRGLRHVRGQVLPGARGDQRAEGRAEAPPAASGSAAAARRSRSSWSPSTATPATSAACDPAIYRHKFDVLREHCDTVGRDYDSIIKSTNLNVYLLEPGEVDRAEAAPRHPAKV